MPRLTSYWVIIQTTFKNWQDSHCYKWIILGAVWSISALYVLSLYDRGWVPHDEGTLGQSAERVLLGEIPHRDFDEIYTGGLSLLHAVAFKILGSSFISLRVTLLVFFLAFVPALYAIVLRFARPDIAALVTLLGVAWSVPNYFAGVPSWYNLFFAIFGTLALTRHIETRLVKWLFLAGLFGGLSVLAKVVGLYYVAAAVLFLVYREQNLAQCAAAEPRTISRSYFLLKTFGLLLFIGLLIAMLSLRLGLMEIFHFVLPQALICGVLLWNEWQEGHGRFLSRVGNLFALLWPFGIGVTIPIALFAGTYFWLDSVGDLWSGMFVLPQKRLSSAAFDFPPFLTVVTSVPYGALVIAPFSFPQTKSARVWMCALIILLGCVLFFSATPWLYYLVWQSARSLGVVAILAGCLFLVHTRRSSHIGSNQRQMLFLLLSMTALLGLVQFPFAAPVYFLYFCPFVCLALCAVIMMQESMPKPRHFVAMLFYLLFAVLTTNSYVWAIGLAYVPFPSESVMENRKGGLRLNDYDNRLYTQVISLIGRYSNSSYIYAGPDCPEIYFLSGKRNLTRNIFDFFSDEASAGTVVTELVDKNKINLIVLNRKPHFSKPLSFPLVAMLQRKFPNSVDVGHFTVRWRE